MTIRLRKMSVAIACRLKFCFAESSFSRLKIEDGNRPACIKDALVDACDQIEEDTLPRVDE